MAKCPHQLYMGGGDTVDYFFLFEINSPQLKMLKYFKTRNRPRE